jgi:hypothetical protein
MKLYSQLSMQTSNIIDADETRGTAYRRAWERAGRERSPERNAR